MILDFGMPYTVATTVFGYKGYRILACLQPQWFVAIKDTGFCYKYLIATAISGYKGYWFSVCLICPWWFVAIKDTGFWYILQPQQYVAINQVTGFLYTLIIAMAVCGYKGYKISVYCTLQPQLFVAIKDTGFCSRLVTTTANKQCEHILISA